MKIKLLLVDDEKEFTDALAQRLEARGFYVATANSGDDALDRLRAAETDIVILDMVMPGKDGIETLHEMKQIRPLVEIILLTGHGTVDTAVATLEKGAFDYLLKPVEMGALLENIASAFKRKAEHEERIRQAEIRRILRAAKEGSTL